MAPSLAATVWPCAGPLTTTRWGLLLVTALGVAILFATRPVAGDQDDHSVIVRGAGTTIVQGGTGPSGGFVPVVTTLAFHP